MKIGVVIPFYQRRAGILPRALNSIRNQALPPGVIVVDDQSPVPAAAEMAGFTDIDTIRWTSVTQKNAGPGGARNTGIDRLVQASDVELVAFLDSDDEWRRDHLGRALLAMENGCDSYFSNHTRPGDCEDCFAKNNAARAALLRLENVGKTLEGTSIRLFAPDEIREVLVHGPGQLGPFGRGTGWLDGLHFALPCAPPSRCSCGGRCCLT